MLPLLMQPSTWLVPLAISYSSPKVNTDAAKKRFQHSRAHIGIWRQKSLCCDDYIIMKCVQWSPGPNFPGNSIPRIQFPGEFNPPGLNFPDRIFWGIQFPPDRISRGIQSPWIEFPPGPNSRWQIPGQEVNNQTTPLSGFIMCLLMSEPDTSYAWWVSLSVCSTTYSEVSLQQFCSPFPLSFVHLRSATADI